jgi:mono/diheme cytochrome c family protein
MKIFTPICFLIFLCSCKSEYPKIDYNYPTDISAKSKKLLQVELNHGMRLYKINCAACHGIIGNGKDSISNFSKKQFDTYTAKILADINIIHRPARKLQAEDLAAIFKFLQYYKRQYH